MSAILPGAGWEDLRDKLCREPGKVMFIGTTDTGKSTLIRWLSGEMVGRGCAVAVVDADVGQSASCLPGTVGVAELSHSTAEYRCGRFSFLGSASPLKVIPSLLKATGYHVEQASRMAEMVLLDTSGLVAGEWGLGVKLAKARIVAPLHLVALQRNAECEHILSRLDRTIVHRLSPHPEARTRSREQRFRTRNARLAAYFAAAPLRDLILREGEIDLLRFGRPVSMGEVPGPGIIIGIGKGIETSALGIVTETDEDTIVCRIRDDGVARGRLVVVYGDVTVEA